MAGLHIGEEEDEVLRVEGVSEDQRSLSNLCLGIQISNLGEKFSVPFFPPENEDPLNMALIYTCFLVQIHGFLSGCFSERVRVWLDIRFSLKHKKIQVSSQNHIYVRENPINRPRGRNGNDLSRSGSLKRINLVLGINLEGPTLRDKRRQNGSITAMGPNSMIHDLEDCPI
ncbi:hypothetical protein Goklo_027914 [Gossypium klotzschianum]|uniref:Uncharacterized protein n=1 Tax=Gossypium klotzschianum TaxID=34286 RepID=A0A7J8TZH4_9ROSI|nr:hypothetical protein [Gossypium klotzschianum]